MEPIVYPWTCESNIIKLHV